MPYSKKVYFCSSNLLIQKQSSNEANMRRVVLFTLLFIASFSVFSQSVDADDLSIQAAIDACVSMRDAAAASDYAAIQQSAENLRACGATYFDGLKSSDTVEGSLNGHLVFNEAFADSLAASDDAYDKADDINRTVTTRGQTADGSILTKTCFVKAGQSTKYSFSSRGRQELAVVAEAGGLVTMRVHVTNSAGLDKRYDDTEDVRKGRPQRKTVFSLPSDRRNTVEVEVVNCGSKDISFVVISN